MSYTPIENIEVGQVLSENVHDINGRLLLSRGQAIESKHIRVFKIWGIAEIKVDDETSAPSQDAPEIDQGKMDVAEASSRHLLMNIDLGRPAAEAVFKCIVNYRYENDFKPTCASPVQLESVDPSNLNFADIKKKVAGGKIKLPEVPTIVIKLNEVMDDPHASSSDVAQIVGSSPSLSTILLRIVNSAAFGLPVKVDSIVRAVSLLGNREISSLAIGISVMQAFQDIPEKIIDMSSFLIHSLACATITRIIAALANIRNTEQLFIAGLLHDVGKLILFKYFPDHSLALLSQHRSEENQQSLYKIEKATIGITHSKIAGLLLKKWNFPDSLQNNIIHHHNPSLADHTEAAVIIQLADIIAHGTGFGSSGECTPPGFDEDAWEQVGVSYNTISMAIRQATHQLKTIKSILG